jgi:ribosomal protein L34
MPELPAELLILAPLALAAGIDLYLTLLLLGAAPTTPWWDHPLPGALGDLDSPGVLIMVGTFYLLEFLAERSAPAGLLWNAFHAAIRPVAGALLALLLLDGAALPVVLAGAALAGALASLAHAVRSGGFVVRWLGSSTSPHALLVSLLEDVLVIGLVVLALDAPPWAFVVAGTLALAALLTSPSHARAFGFAVRLATARGFQTLTHRRWTGPEEIPLWVRRALERDVFGPGGALRGSPVGAHRLPGAPRFTTGWIVIHGGSPVFVFPRGILPGRVGGRAKAVDIGALVGERVVEKGFFRRVDLETVGGPPACVFFGVDGPSVESLRTEFLFARSGA